MHSCPIMVESMSARNSFLRRPSPRLHDDIDGQIADARRAAASATSRALSARRRTECRRRRPRTASPRPAHPAKSRARRRWPCYRARAWPGLQMSVATRDMSVPDMPETSPATDAGRAVLIAGPTASGKSALALRAGRTDAAASSSIPIPCRSIATCASSPRGRRADEEARVPHRLYGHRRRGGELFGRHAGSTMRRPRSPRRARRGGCRSSSAAPGCTSRRCCAGLSNVPPVPAEHPRGGARAA